MDTEQVFDYLANLFYEIDSQEHRDKVSKIQKLLIEITEWDY